MSNPPVINQLKCFFESELLKFCGLSFFWVSIEKSESLCKIYLLHSVDNIRIWVNYSQKRPFLCNYTWFFRKFSFGCYEWVFIVIDLPAKELVLIFSKSIMVLIVQKYIVLNIYRKNKGSVLYSNNTEYSLFSSWTDNSILTNRYPRILILFLRGYEMKRVYIIHNYLYS